MHQNTASLEIVRANANSTAFAACDANVRFVDIARAAKLAAKVAPAVEPEDVHHFAWDTHHLVAATQE